MSKLVFTEHPVVVLATNTFIRVPVVLQYEDTPLIQVVRLQQAGYTTEIPIYHADGTYLAKVVGSQLYATEDGTKAGIRLEHPDRMTICRQGEKVLFEIRRDEAAALHTQAELYAPDGYFVKCDASPRPQLIDSSGKALNVGGVTMQGCNIVGCRIGVWVRKDGIAIGAN